MHKVVFYFAWADAGEAYNPAVHNVEDEDIFSFTFSQAEGDFASLECVIRNPRIGFLAPGRKVWAWLSASVDDGVPFPMFFGRLLAIPQNVFETLVTVNFTAKPTDFAAQKLALAASLKVAPFWDDIFISPDNWDDPDVVLEARTQLWHIDPVTHILTVSDIIIPEDGVVEFGATDFFYDSMSMTLNQIPARSMQIVANIPWTQSAAGDVDISSRFLFVWPNDDFGQRLISSFTFKGLLGSWPQQGARVGSGWVVKYGELVDVSFTSRAEKAIPPYYDQSNMPALPAGSILYPERLTSGTLYSGVDGASYDTSVQSVFAPLGWGIPKMVVSYGANRKFVETVVINMTTDQQALVTMPGEDEAILLKLNANEVTDLDANGDMPLGNTLKRSYLDTDRGKQSIEHLISIGRATLAARSRAVLTEFQTDFVSGLAATLRKGLKLTDPRIPGGEAVGKCVYYSLTVEGDSGTALATLRMASCVGYGGAYAPADGDPIYVDDDYVDPEYQEYEAEVILLGTEDVTYTPPAQEDFDDGIDFERGINSNNALVHLLVENGPKDQREAIEGNPGVDTSAVQSILQQIPTRVNLKLIHLEGGPFLATKPIDVSDLILPKQIDLEAPSA